MALTSPMAAPDARVARDGTCKGCKSPTKNCANCHGTGTKKRDGSPCMACKSTGKKAFCENEKCRDAYYRNKAQRPAA